jgi:hypothetical protein
MWILASSSCRSIISLKGVQFATTSRKKFFLKSTILGNFAMKNRLRALPKRENASLTLIHGKYRFFEPKKALVLCLKRRFSINKPL